MATVRWPTRQLVRHRSSGGQFLYVFGLAALKSRAACDEEHYVRKVNQWLENWKKTNSFDLQLTERKVCHERSVVNGSFANQRVADLQPKLAI